MVLGLCPRTQSRKKPTETFRSDPVLKSSDINCAFGEVKRELKLRLGCLMLLMKVLLIGCTKTMEFCKSGIGG